MFMMLIIIMNNIIVPLSLFPSPTFYFCFFLTIIKTSPFLALNLANLSYSEFP